MLALSTVNCAIFKIINHCELCNTQDNFAHNNTLPYAELQFLACMYDLKTPFYIDIQCLLPEMLCGCNLHIATPHCVQSVLKIANHNRLENSSEPRNPESIKWDCTIVLQYIEFHLVSSRSLSGRTIVRCSLLAYPPSASPLLLSSWYSSGSVIVLLFWRVSLSTFCFCKGLDLFRRLVGPFDTGNKQSCPIQQPL